MHCTINLLNAIYSIQETYGSAPEIFLGALGEEQPGSYRASKVITNAQWRFRTPNKMRRVYHFTEAAGHLKVEESFFFPQDF
jgi:hypothetical protein